MTMSFPEAIEFVKQCVVLQTISVRFYSGADHGAIRRPTGCGVPARGEPAVSFAFAPVHSMLSLPGMRQKESTKLKSTVEEDARERGANVSHRYQAHGGSAHHTGLRRLPLLPPEPLDVAEKHRIYI